MRKKSLFIFLGILLLVAVVATSVVLSAQSYRLNAGQLQAIDEWSDCKQVQSTSGTGTDYFIPTNTAAEWTAFQNNKPATVSLSACQYLVANSLLFDSSQSQYLSRTFGAPTNRDKWTWSGWVKRSKIGVQGRIFSAYPSVGNGSSLLFNADDTLSYVSEASSSNTHYITTNAVFRDPSSWYHIVLIYDYANSTADDRMQLYINGIQQTSFFNRLNPTGASQTYINGNTFVGEFSGRNPAASDGYFDGYLSDTYFVDGQALTPSSFGQADATTGMWEPIAYSGTYGTNGFHLAFTNSGSLGTDSSGNANTWTVNGGMTAAANQVIDTPTDNFATLNPVDTSVGGSMSAMTYSVGALEASQSTYGEAYGSIAVSSGKWYFEVQETSSVASDTRAGIKAITESRSEFLGNAGSSSYGYRFNTGEKLYSGVSTAYGSAMTSSDRLGVAIDLDNGKIWFRVNGAWQASGDPVAGTNAAFTGLSGTFTPSISNGNGAAKTWKVNFGQRPFEFSVPTGFKSLSTANLPQPAIVKPNQYFDAVAYTGNSGTNTITGLSFQPDLVWLKARSYSSSNHLLNDSVRGGNKTLFSNQTLAEYTDRGVDSFDASGFTLSGTEGGDGNVNGATYVAWSWKAGGAAAANTAGTITSQVSANPTAGFSVVTYTGSSTSTAETIGHGLGAVPEFIITKNRTSVRDWGVYHKDASTSTKDTILSLNATSAVTTAGGGLFQGTTSPFTSSVYSIKGSTTGSNDFLNGASQTYVSYVFTSTPGFSKFGSYTGNGSTNGTFVYTGFRPRYILQKRIDNTGDWGVYDTVRDTYNPLKYELDADLSIAETTAGGDRFDVTANGFKLRTSGAAYNISGGTYIFVAFAEAPFKYANAR